MKTNNTTVKLLGAAFLFQAFASAIGMLVLKDPLIVSGDIIATMINISNHPVQMGLSNVIIVLTALGVACLGTLLYMVLKDQNETISRIALGFYLIEAAILAVSRIPAFSLIGISHESVMAGHPVYLQSLGNLCFQAADWGDWIHMLVFTVGASFFYSLFVKSKFIPRALSVFGLVAVSIGLIGTILVLLGINLPLFVFIPSLPFELGIGFWLLIKGIKVGTK